jgi:hypothetical protein
MKMRHEPSRSLTSMASTHDAKLTCRLRGSARGHGPLPTAKMEIPAASRQLCAPLHPWRSTPSELLTRHFRGSCGANASLTTNRPQRGTAFSRIIELHDRQMQRRMSPLFDITYQAYVE